MTNGELEIAWQCLGAEIYTLENREKRLYIATFDSPKVARVVVDTHNRELASRTSERKENG